MIDWIFNPTPPSGSKTGGDPSERTLEVNIDTFVREVIQNSKDARIENLNEPVHVSFELRELSGKYLSEFLETIKWQTLKSHINSTSKEKIKRAETYRIVLEKIEKNKKLTVLTIKDSHTIGLCGQETTDDNSKTGKKNFSSLVKDKLTSSKNEGSGGNYGLGKSCYWAFSELSTVLFYSILYHLEPNQDKNRFIGRTNLASHVDSGESFSPDGWFGLIRDNGKGKFSESLHSNDAMEFANKTYLSRKLNETGSSIMVLGFHDPSSEKDNTIEELEDKIKRATVKWWWPAMVGKTPSLIVGTKRVQNVTTKGESFVSDFSEIEKLKQIRDAYLTNNYSNDLINPGDIVQRNITIPKIPATIKGDVKSVENAEVDLLVYLDEDVDKQNFYQNKIAVYRGPEMVVKYDDPKRSFVSPLPFFAVLICGSARVFGDQFENSIVDKFLMNSEPPSHNDWSSEKGVLKDTYKQGYGKALKDLDKDIIIKLRELLTRQLISNDNGPALLMQKFPLGKNDYTPPTPKDFAFQSFKAERTKDGWKFSGKVFTKKELKKDWEISIDFQLNDEDGGVEAGYITEIKVDNGKVSLNDGRALVNVSLKDDLVNFSGKSNLFKHKIDPKRTTVRLAVTAKEK